MDTAKELSEKYERRMQSARAEFSQTASIQQLTSPNTGGEFLLLFIINYCAYGVAMTEPTERWILGAGERCEAMGLKEEGLIYKRRAKKQADHHLRRKADVTLLVSFWNERFPKHPLDPSLLLNRPFPPAVVQYHQFHEDLISSSEPMRQFAIEYEISRLTLEYGAWLITRYVEKFGKEILNYMPSLEKDICVDFGYIQSRWTELGRLLSNYPDSLDKFIETGSTALKIYQEFVENCLEAAHDQLSKIELPNLVIRPVRDVFELWEVYRLTYSCYVGRAYTHPRPTGFLVHYAEFDHIPESTVLVGIRHGKIIGTVSYTVEGPEGFPFDHDYPNLTHVMHRPGQHGVGIWRLAVEESLRSDRMIVFQLIKGLIDRLEETSTDTVFFSVNPRHENLYKRLLHMESLGTSQGTEGLQNAPVVLLRGKRQEILAALNGKKSSPFTSLNQ